MINLTYNPFPVDNVDDITADHLDILRNVAEGWYVEYKRQQVNTASIAKSISSFANHYGGWIFYGVEETSDGSLTAGAFPGIPSTVTATFIETIKNSAKDSIHPSPYYEYAIVSGPEPAIGLAAGNSIVIVMVPIGPDAPYVHRNGRIYRRVADSSDPTHETDRLVLDQLWKRRQQAREELEVFLFQRPELSQGEDETPYVDVLFLPDPLGASGQRTELSFRDFVDVMTESHDEWMAQLHFDNFYSMAGGYVARSVGVNDPYNLTPTWRHYRNGWSAISVPLSATGILALEDLGWLQGYHHGSEFTRSALTQRHDSSQVIDVNQFVAALLGLVSYQDALMSAGGIGGRLYAKLVLCGMWRKVPFFDTEAYVNFVADHGFPVIQSDEFLAPPGFDFGDLMKIHEPDEIGLQSEHAAQLRLFVPLLRHTLAAMGLPPAEVLADELEWLDAVYRSLEVQKNRG